MMKLALIFIGLFTVTLCYAKTDEQLLQEAKNSVQNELNKNYKPGECEKWKSLEAGSSIAAGKAIPVCDNAFDVKKGIVFTDVKIYRHEKMNAVCGIVSGHTDISRIGGRFVYTDYGNGRAFVKQSKYPTLLASNTELSRGAIKLLENQLQIESRQCSEGK